MGVHSSHRTRFSMSASTYDEICELCGAHDELMGFGMLACTCPATQEARDLYDAQHSTSKDCKHAEEGQEAPER